MKAAFPGSFDPVTYGHLDIIARASRVFDEVFVVVAENRRKAGLFSLPERRNMLEELTREWKNVTVDVCGGLIVDFLRKNGVPVIVRGLRGAADFAYEYETACFNASAAGEIETVFLASRPEHIAIRSSSVREFASFGGDVSPMTPPLVAQALRAKFAPSLKRQN